MSHPHLFLRARKKGFSFFSCGATSSRTVPKTQPLQVAFSLRERVDLRSQKGRILGKKIAWGRVGRTGQKKGKKDAQKKVGIQFLDLLAPARLPPMQKQDARHKFLQHKATHRRAHVGGGA